MSKCVCARNSQRPLSSDLFVRDSSAARRNQDTCYLSRNKISLCNLCVLCVSVVIGMCDTTTTEAQRTQRLHREEVEIRTLPSQTASLRTSVLLLKMAVLYSGSAPRGHQICSYLCLYQRRNS